MPLPFGFLVCICDAFLFPLEREFASSVGEAAEEQRIPPLYQAFRETVTLTRWGVGQCQHWVCVFESAIAALIQKSAKHVPRMLFYCVKESVECSSVA